MNPYKLHWTEKPHSSQNTYLNYVDSSQSLKNTLKHTLTKQMEFHSIQSNSFSNHIIEEKTHYKPTQIDTNTQSLSSTLLVWSS